MKLTQKLINMKVEDEHLIVPLQALDNAITWRKGQIQVTQESMVTTPDARQVIIGQCKEEIRFLEKSIEVLKNNDLDGLTRFIITHYDTERLGENNNIDEDVQMVVDSYLEFIRKQESI